MEKRALSTARRGSRNQSSPPPPGKRKARRDIRTENAFPESVSFPAEISPVPLPALRTPAADPDAPELLDAADGRTVGVEWNHTDADYPAERCIRQLFQEQAERTPDAVAPVHETESLSSPARG